MNLTDNNLYLNNKEKNASCNSYHCYKMNFNDNHIVYKYSCNWRMKQKESPLFFVYSLRFSDFYCNLGDSIDKGTISLQGEVYLFQTEYFEYSYN